MGETLKALRMWVGGELVRVGLRLLGIEMPSGGTLVATEKEIHLEPELDDDDILPPGVAPVVLSDTAREMIEAGQPKWVRPKVEEEQPLKGSIAARLQHARREMGR